VNAAGPGSAAFVDMFRGFAVGVVLASAYTIVYLRKFQPKDGREIK